MKVIALTTFNRHEYTRKVLDALSLCDNIEEYTIVAQAEPGCDEVINLLEEISFCKKKIFINYKRLGCGWNRYEALRNAFKLSDYVISLEDDTIPAKDCLRYFEYCRERFKDDEEIFTICAGSRSDSKTKEEDYHMITRWRWFSALGWATWRDRWEEMKAQWWQFNRYGGFDALLTHNADLHKGRFEIHPILSRTQNIGEIGGVHPVSKTYFEENIKVKFFAGDLVLENKPFCLDNYITTPIEGEWKTFHRDTKKSLELCYVR